MTEIEELRERVAQLEVAVTALSETNRLVLARTWGPTARVRREASRAFDLVCATIPGVVDSI